MQFYTFHFWTKVVKRLVDAYPAFGPVPAGRGKDLEAWDVAAAAAQPFSFFTKRDFKICVFTFNVQLFDLQVRQFFGYAFNFCTYSLPLFYGVSFIQVAGFYNLLPVLLLRQAGFLGH